MLTALNVSVRQLDVDGSWVGTTIATIADNNSPCSLLRSIGELRASDCSQRWCILWARLDMVSSVVLEVLTSAPWSVFSLLVCKLLAMSAAGRAM